MKDFITVLFGGGAITGLIVLLFLIGPILMLWAVNSLAEAGGASFYIEHNIWNYFVAFVLLCLVRGGSSSSSE